MKIFFLGDIVGRSGRAAIYKNLRNIIKDKKIDFVVANAENAADQGVGITEEISNEVIQYLEENLQRSIQIETSDHRKLCDKEMIINEMCSVDKEIEESNRYWENHDCSEEENHEDEHDHP